MVERVELNYAMTVYVEPQAADWCRQLSSRPPQEELGITTSRLIYRAFTALSFNGRGNGVHLFDGQPQTTLKPIDVLVPPKLQEKLRETTESLGLNPENHEDVQRIAAHLVRVAYVQAHPILLPPPVPRGHTLTPKDRYKILFGESEEEKEESGEVAREHPEGRRLAIRRVIAGIMGENFVNTEAIVIGQTEDGSLDEIPDVVSVKPAKTRGGQGGFTGLKAAYPFKIDPEEQAEFEKEPLFSPKEIRERREALGVSQAALAVSLNIRRGWKYVSDAENGRRAGSNARKILTHGILHLKAHPEHIKRNSIKNPARASRILK